MVARRFWLIPGPIIAAILLTYSTRDITLEDNMVGLRLSKSDFDP